MVLRGFSIVPGSSGSEGASMGRPHNTQRKSVPLWDRTPLRFPPLFAPVCRYVRRCREGQGPCPLSVDSGRIWAAVSPLRRSVYSGHPPPPGLFLEDEKKSGRKNRRFCCAGSITTARSAGGCGILKGSRSAHEIVVLTPFSVKFSCLLSAAKNGQGVPAQ